MNVSELIFLAKNKLIEINERDGEKFFPTEFDVICQLLVDAEYQYRTEKEQNEIRRCGNCKYADRVPCYCDLWEEEHATSYQCSAFIESEVIS